MGPYRPLNIPTLETDSQVILDKASSTGPLLTTRNKPLPARQTIFNHNRTFVLAFDPPHLPPAPYITWILSPTPMTSHELHIWPPLTSQLTSRWRERSGGLLLFLWYLRCEMVTWGLLTSVAVSESLSWDPWAHLGRAAKKAHPVNIECGKSPVLED